MNRRACKLLVISILVLVVTLWLGSLVVFAGMGWSG
jgi:hypothetical protein